MSLSIGRIWPDIDFAVSEAKNTASAAIERPDHIYPFYPLSPSPWGERLILGRVTII